MEFTSNFVDYLFQPLYTCPSEKQLNLKSMQTSGTAGQQEFHVYGRFAFEAVLGTLTCSMHCRVSSA